jgi:hypothetical protein
VRGRASERSVRRPRRASRRRAAQGLARGLRVRGRARRDARAMRRRRAHHRARRDARGSALVRRGRAARHAFPVGCPLRVADTARPASARERGGEDARSGRGAPRPRAARGARVCLGGGRAAPVLRGAARRTVSVAAPGQATRPEPRGPVRGQPPLVSRHHGDAQRQPRRSRAGGEHGRAVGGHGASARCGPRGPGPGRDGRDDVRRGPSAGVAGGLRRRPRRPRGSSLRAGRGPDAGRRRGRAHRPRASERAHGLPHRGRLRGSVDPACGEPWPALWRRDDAHAPRQDHRRGAPLQRPAHPRAGPPSAFAPRRGRHARRRGRGPGGRLGVAPARGLPGPVADRHGGRALRRPNRRGRAVGRRPCGECEAACAHRARRPRRARARAPRD